MRRLTAKTVLSGFVTAWRLAGWPTRRSPSLVNATIDGVVRAPSEFSITLVFSPSIMETQELVVPKSIPMILLMIYLLFLADFSTASNQSAVQISTYKYTADSTKKLHPPAGKEKRILLMKSK